MRAALAFLTSLAAASALADDAPAKQHFDAGAAAYDAGRYADAAWEFEAARAAGPSPELDFNVGRARDRMGDAKAAVEAYGRYLAARPGAADAGEVRARVSALRAELAKKEPTPVLVVNQPAPVPAPVMLGAAARRPDRLRIAAWAVGGTALGLAAAGAGLAGSAHADYGSLSCSPACRPSDWAGIRGREYAGAALLGAAGAVLAADVVLWAVKARRGR
jgi:hypothetical protein